MIEAQQLLNQITVASYPHIKEASKQREIHKSLHKKAFPETHKGPPVGPEDLARLLGAGRI